MDAFIFNEILEKNKNAYYQVCKVNRKNQFVGNLYKLDKPLTDEQKADILAHTKNVEFMQVRSQYAPELQSKAVLFYSKAEIKRMNNAKY